MRAYIRSAACISPQITFDDSGFMTGVTEYNNTRLKAIEPDYKNFIDPKQIRRMSHIIKMGVAAAMQCLHKSGVAMPGAIITGTAYGCLEDTVTFLSRIVEQNEELLPPTAFIQSTHNTVAAQIALMLQCHNYNNTFVHRGISFESALLDAMMLLAENEADNILVGAADEITDTSFTILNRLGIYKREAVSNLSLYTSGTKGTIAGEGAAFFALSDKPAGCDLAELTALRSWFMLKDGELEPKISSFLIEHDLQMSDFDLVITGRNGDLKNDSMYDALGNSLLKATPQANYKHLCGEYPTSTSFALWLAANIIKNGSVPAGILANDHQPPQLKKVLICNRYLKYDSVMVVAGV